MTANATLLLTSPDGRMVATLSRLRPDLQVVSLGPAVPPERFRGTVWGFVDWLLPELSGLELCRRLREAENTRHAHLTMVLENPDAEARRRALAAGADDYIVGPLTPEALLDRIEAANPERSRPGSGPRLRHGDITIDLAAFQARFKGKILPLRPNEFRLLVHFVENPDQVFSRGSLIGRLGKDAEVIDERTVDVWIGRLRRGLRAHGVPDPLRTVRSMGYVMDSLPG
jgi:two-component system phosphate regulon response regulator PhoB